MMLILGSFVGDIKGQDCIVEECAGSVRGVRWWWGWFGGRLEYKDLILE